MTKNFFIALWIWLVHHLLCSNLSLLSQQRVSGQERAVLAVVVCHIRTFFVVVWIIVLVPMALLFYQPRSRFGNGAAFLFSGISLFVLRGNLYDSLLFSVTLSIEATGRCYSFGLLVIDKLLPITQEYWYWLSLISCADN